MDEQKVRLLIQQEMAKIFHSEKYHFSRDVQLANGRNIELGKSIGTMIGTESTQKLAFLGKTPLARQTGASSPTSPSVGYVQAEAQSAVTAINAINAVLSNVGITN